MLAAMPVPPTSPADRDETCRTGASPRDRGDACPGALRLHSAADGALARIRVPAGLLTTRQAEALAGLAEELGDGHLDLTSRGNLQLRGLPSDCGAVLAARLRAAGLLPSDAHERVRNLVASPLSGLDGSGHADVQAWARELDRLLCENPDITALSGRFLFGLDDGRGDVAALDPDVTLIAEEGDQAVLRYATGPAGLRIPAADAPRAAVLAAEHFLGTLRAHEVTAWRIKDLAPQHRPPLDALADRLVEAGIPAEAIGGTAALAGPAAAGPTVAASAVAGPTAAGSALAEPAGAGPTSGPAPAVDTAAGPGPVAVPGPTAEAGPVAGPGPVPEPGPVVGPDGRCALSVTAPLGRLTVGQWRLLARTAAEAGTGELRVTPWRGIVLPGLPRGAAAARLAVLADAGLVTSPASPWHRAGACAGRPGCARSLTDVRADASAALTDARPGGPRVLPVYWSGCERRCGHPSDGPWVDVLATADGYRVTVRTGAPDTPHAVAPETAPELAEAVTTARTPGIAPRTTTATTATAAPPPGTTRTT
ncbi:precorrin-3B synthase [Streptomyces sp. SCA3-4]|uniref:precorrin-3B synthase n=1 Tax=Streptomyces sichuanensis TaxID=2871810 RepID=UPI001CE2D4BE|nr:precorrin-3B synthase [Streptomyces sichuanensis]MCA6092136.1 precorrin-3B synthase [Streptomyces sichuanensis]